MELSEQTCYWLTGVCFVASLWPMHYLYRYWKSLPYRQGNPENPKTFFINGTFTHRTLSGFKVEYALKLLCERIDNEEFKKAWMLDPAVQSELATAYNTEIFHPHFENQSCFFHLERNADATAAPLACRLTEPWEDLLSIRELPPTPIRYDFDDIPSFRKNGCEVVLASFETKPLTPQLVEENYTMLTDKQKELILANDRYGAIEEMCAVAALKRRFDFLDNNEQRHETDYIVLETTKAGRGVKIKWNFKPDASGFELRGFRKTGGFFSDQWDENNNGTLVVHSARDGQVVEFLPESEATFYTFFLVGSAEKGKVTRFRSPIRFQITIASKDELEEINAALDRSNEKKQPDPRMSELITELGLVMEFHDAMDDMERSLEAKIKSKKLSPEEEEEKLAFVKDAVRLQREKYQP